MKKGLIILFGMIILAGCKKDDTNENNNQQGISESDLKSHVFTNRRVFVQQKDVTHESLRNCDMDNDYRFLDEGRIQVSDHGITCPNTTDGGWVTDPGAWQLLPGGTQMVHYGTTLKVALGTTKLTLTDPNEATNYTTYDIK